MEVESLPSALPLWGPKKTQLDLEIVTTKADCFDISSKLMTCLSVLYRFVIWTSAFGLLINIQHLRTNVFLLQCLFGTISIPANLLGIVLVNHMGRRTSQPFIMSLFGISLLAIVFVPQGEEKIRGEQRNDLLPFPWYF